MTDVEVLSVDEIIETDACHVLSRIIHAPFLVQPVGAQAEVRETTDSITIYPPEKLQPATIETYNDHRMAMCFSLVALGGVPVKIMDPACINKTYPKYFDDFLRIAK